MLLKTHRWGSEGAPDVVCVHGLAQHGRVFDGLAQRLSAGGHSTLAVDLRGHGDSGREPPWNTESQIADLFETLDAAGVGPATWIGHSFGARLAAGAAAAAPERFERLALLDPGLEVSSERALRSAEVERLDWSFLSVDGALNALLSSESVVAAPRDVVAEFVRDDVRQGPDGRFRFGFCPSAAVVAWSEMALPPPPIARLPTLLLRAEASQSVGTGLEARYRDALGELLTVVTVPNGHNVLWESPVETAAAVEEFLASGRVV